MGGWFTCALDGDAGHKDTGRFLVERAGDRAHIAHVIQPVAGIGGDPEAEMTRGVLILSNKLWRGG